MEKLNKLASLCAVSVSLEYREQANYYETLKQAVENDDYFGDDSVH